MKHTRMILTALMAAALALALAGLYMLLTFTPPAWGPFLAPPG